MQARRMLSLSAVFLTVCCMGAMAACGSGDTTTVYVLIEAGADSGRRDATTPVPAGDDDDSTTDSGTCSPQTVAAFTFKSGGAHQGVCDEATLNQLYTACISDSNTISGCNALKAAGAPSAGCAACAFGKVSDPVAHPWMVYDEQVVPFVNTGLCMSAISGETAATDCSVGYGQSFECLDQACVTPCATLGSQAAFDACRKAAVGTTCTAGLDVASSQACQTKYQDGKTYGFCTSAKKPDGVTDMTDQEYYVAVANLVCGTNPDGGAPKDAGPDADAGQSDAGDAGDADADTGTGL